eukprot:10938559-Alexandrium_andersonii.AAC.1
MSASLVGSEMCIRDRDLKGPRMLARVRYDQAQRPLHADRQPDDQVLRGVCLLYTSDAADDM